MMFIIKYMIYYFTQDESDTARDIKNMLTALGIIPPPVEANIIPGILFEEIKSEITKIQDYSCQKSKEKNEPIINMPLSVKQWEKLSELQKELHKEYTLRREMLLKRLDVTVQSFLVRYNI